jgi:hypothetical protein
MGRLAPILTGAFVVFCLLGSDTARVYAHGEHNLEPFIRMRGVTFFNVSFSHDRLNVNVTMTVTG